ncbi:uncharacterized protein CIMG_12810 [Coccidioides immitis RS]|uniref:Uncharacterized protein n=1 Tax=Coccidioides immitis (strain RS) TaxID=246410 RepID=A0A0D8JSA8_COCIM|nr:uncharacterized protein CIMG_12810 [Coccidioides immitis RS]KJF60225.1 hypothetical protein CIMG_12810 [Coccidioides immitis RS]
MFPAFSYLPRGKKHQESQQPISLPLGPFPRPPLAGTRSRRFSFSEHMCTIGPWGCGPSLRGRAGRSRARFSSLEIWGKKEELVPKLVYRETLLAVDVDIPQTLQVACMHILTTVVLLFLFGS